MLQIEADDLRRSRRFGNPGLPCETKALFRVRKSTGGRDAPGFYRRHPIVRIPRCGRRLETALNRPE